MDNPILHYEQDDRIIQYFTFMKESKGYHKAREIQLIGLLYSLLSLLVEFGPAMPISEHKESRAEIYVEKVKDFIETNFAQKITIEDIAQYIGRNRSYLGSLFQQQLNTSIQQYLLRYRIDKACEMMSSAELTIGDIARSVGYPDSLLFSKMFKKVTGSSPKQHRIEARKK